MINNPDYQTLSLEDKNAALEEQNKRLNKKLAEALEQMCHWMNVAKSYEKTNEHNHN